MYSYIRNDKAGIRDWSKTHSCHRRALLERLPGRLPRQTWRHQQVPLCEIGRCTLICRFEMVPSTWFYLGTGWWFAWSACFFCFLLTLLNFLSTILATLEIYHKDHKGSWTITWPVENTSSFAETSVNENDNVLPLTSLKTIGGSREKEALLWPPNASHLAAKGDRNKVKECKRCNVLSLQPGPRESFRCLRVECLECLGSNDSIYIYIYMWLHWLPKERDIYSSNFNLMMRTLVRTF